MKTVFSFEQSKGTMIFIRTAGCKKTLEKLRDFMYNEEIYCPIFEGTVLGIRLFVCEVDYEKFLRFCEANNIKENHNED